MSHRPDETTYEEENSACKEIYWPQMTEAIHSILSRAGSDAALLSSDERKALGERLPFGMSVFTENTRKSTSIYFHGTKVSVTLAWERKMYPFSITIGKW
jgi:hypothetical protein